MTEKKQKLTVFHLSSDAALEFYQRCLLENANTEQDRIALLVQMASEGKVEAVSQTGRSKEEYIRDISREQTVLDLSQSTEEDSDETV